MNIIISFKQRNDCSYLQLMKDVERGREGKWREKVRRRGKEGGEGSSGLW